MKFFLDDVEWKLNSLDTTRTQVLEEIKAFAAQNGRVVISWQLDGNQISEDALIASSAGSEIRAESKDIKTLISESLDQTEQYLPMLISGLESVSDKLESNDPEGALHLFQQATEGMGWVLQVLHHCGNLLGVTPGSHFDLPGECAKLQETLESLAESLREGKFLQMAHLIREVLIPRLRGFDPYLKRLQEESRSHRTAQ